MMSVVYVVWMYVVVFAVIGALRGWAKEILVIFSVILALAVNHVMRRYIPLINTLPDDSSSVLDSRFDIAGIGVLWVSNCYLCSTSGCQGGAR
jgi:uncharacterized membrane protein required for colicin V production